MQFLRCQSIRRRMKSVLVLLLLSSFPFAGLAAERVDVDVDGLSRAQRKNVERFLDIERRRKDDDLTAAWIRRLHERAPEQIRAALAPFR
jgi:translocation and assembly module TamA